ncbi:hypothetical protein BAZSYMA_ACONTIG150583_3 [Bathymodiolus azoricus thioautotrophic gill symbiont]|uniref:Uncharacterized protein n=1 Tax=Bathymodiolus azoricus thioautotrophic gill symbiont TaxID=235205 RepID=A0A1H6MKY8_9GAMM|nr:hypothetical protein BAZSYMA_ACONTIG150583_3 [Bathymodiolus azoricus thioautotrophic gill symbiont]
MAYQSTLPSPIFMFISAIEAPSGSRLPSSFSAAKVVSKSLAITRIFNLPSKPSIDLFSCSEPSSPTETTR